MMCIIRDHSTSNILERDQAHSPAETCISDTLHFRHPSFIHFLPSFETSRGVALDQTPGATGLWANNPKKKAKNPKRGGRHARWS
mmetsp:Transcript_13609/g.24597  ORF Transcript_13609/g.24597 Transcript_13609/m.24597 type:complete len:85 (+) Transcript_13609:729-983(+)